LLNIEFNLDKIWDIITNRILEAANKFILKKKILNMVTNQKKNIKKTELAKASIKVRKIIRLAKRNLSNEITREIEQITNNTIREINRSLETEIPLVVNTWTEEWIDDIKGW